MWYHHRGIVTRNIAASKINDAGVRVYIPLRGQKNGVRWITPISVYGMKIGSPYPLLLSFDTAVTVPLDFNYTEVTMYAPFSMAMLRQYTQKAAAANLQRSWVRTTIPDADERAAADPEALAAYDAGKVFMGHAENAAAAWALGIKQPTQINKIGDNMPTVLKSDYEIAIRFKDGGNITKYVPLEDINDYISSEETGALSALQTAIGTYAGEADLATDLADIHATIKQQGVEAKLAAVAAGVDPLPSEESNKHLVEPVINGTLTRAYCDIDLVGTSKKLRITARDFGTAGNALSVALEAADVEAETIVSFAEATLTITCGVDGDGEIITTAYDIVKRLREDGDIADKFILGYSDGTAIGAVDGYAIDTAEIGTIALAGGTDMATLKASSTEIDAALANSPEAASTPTLEQTFASGTIAVTQLPTAGETFTIGTETYTFVTTLVDGGRPNEVLISGVDIDDQCQGIVYAINASADEGHSSYYGAGTVANPHVVAVANATSVTLTANTIGTTANDVETTTPVGQTSVVFGQDHLTGGQDITAAAAGKIIVGPSAIYVAKANCTASENNWVQIPHTPANMTPVTTIYLSGGVDYVAAPTDTIIAVTNTDGTDGDIILPAATGSQRKITVSIQHADNAIDVIPAEADTINLAASLSATALSTVTLLDYASGKWMTV